MEIQNPQEPYDFLRQLYEANHLSKQDGEDFDRKCSLLIRKVICNPCSEGEPILQNLEMEYLKEHGFDYF